MISDFIEKLQNKPRHVRVIIMWTGVAIFMTALFIFWVVTLDIGRNKNSTDSAADFEESLPLAEAKKNIPSLWESIKTGITDLFNLQNQEAQQEQDVESVSEQESAPKIEIGEPGQTDENIVPPSELPKN